MLRIDVRQLFRNTANANWSGALWGRRLSIVSRLQVRSGGRLSRLLPLPGSPSAISVATRLAAEDDRGLRAADRDDGQGGRGDARHRDTGNFIDGDAGWRMGANLHFPQVAASADRVAIPTRWAMHGPDAVTWRGLGFSVVALPIALLLGCALVFGAIAAMRFRGKRSDSARRSQLRRLLSRKTRRSRGGRASQGPGEAERSGGGIMRSIHIRQRRAKFTRHAAARLQSTGRRFSP
jgi:hypothetical protein